MKKIKSVQLLVTSDIHGFIMPTTFRKTEENLGFAKAASIIEDLREKKQSLLIDNGDLLQGSPLTYFHQQFHADEKNPVIDVTNALGYDLAVFGNHEFNYGLSFLEKSVQESQFPWVSGNIYREDGSFFYDSLCDKRNRWCGDRHCWGHNPFCAVMGRSKTYRRNPIL